MLSLKTKRLLIGTLVVYGLLVTTHLGEFWPFSIYPMFSRGGHDWSRAIVRDVTTLDDAIRWEPTTIDDLPGRAVALEKLGINQNDIANFVAKSNDWSPKRVAAMRKVFGPVLNSENLLLFRAEGHLEDDKRVDVRFTPFVLMARDSTVFNPFLDVKLKSNNTPS